MFAPSEVVTLALTVISAPAAMMLSRELRLRSVRLFALGFGSMLLSLVATNLEAVVMPEAFNALEHGFLAFSGVAFLAGSLGLSADMSARD